MQPLEIGSTMPNLPPMPGADWRSYADESFDTANVLVIGFIANHCRHSERIEPALKRFVQRFATQGALLATINSCDESAHPDDCYEQMVLRAREHEFPFAYLRDYTQEVAQSFGATQTPEFFVFDSERRLRYRGAFDDSSEDRPPTKEYLAEAVSQVLDGVAVETERTEVRGSAIEPRSVR